MVKQEFDAPYEGVPSNDWGQPNNDWGQPNRLAPNSGCDLKGAQD
jgi:hypothetical protein